jgi:hypothetical protein
VIEATGNEVIEGVFAGVTTWSVATVVTEGDGFGESDIESRCAGDTAGYLSYFEGVSEASALVVFGEDEDLGLAGETSERTGVQDAVTVAFKAGSKVVRLLLTGALAGAL